MRDMACGGPYFSKLLLNAIYFGSAKFSPRLEVRKDITDVRTAGWKYRQRVKELLGLELERSSITTIQALLIMANSLFALGNERSAAWLYSGLAFRMIIDLGVHSEASTLRAQALSDEDIEIRRRVFWGAFGRLKFLRKMSTNCLSGRQDSVALSRTHAYITDRRCKCANQLS